jgi:hypothetical protein
MEKNKIYLNRNVSDYFEIPYNNDSKEFIVNTDALKRANKEWDSQHLEIFNKYKGDLHLKGVGYGWWKIS